MRNIIGICGRKESGKSVIGQVCKEYGYEVIRFAEPLKRLISSLIKVERSDLDSLKTVVKNYTFTEEDCKFVEQETGVPYECIAGKLLGKSFPTVRDLLQVIGTDIIREYNINWHVNKIREYVTSDDKKDVKFLIDDVRFPNERKMIEELGGSCWFIVRPRVDNVSNHISETALRWQDFENIIVNDSTEEYLRFNFEMFMDNGYHKSLDMRHKILERLSDYGQEDFKGDAKFTLLGAMLISQYQLTYKPKFRDKLDGEIVWAEYGSVSIKHTDGTIEKVTNPLEIEDLKMFLP